MSKKVLPKYEVTLLADDVREEKNGKTSLIGVYTGGGIIMEGALPAAFPKLCFFVRYRGGDGEFAIGFSLNDPDGNVMSKKENAAKLVAKKNTCGNLNVILAPFNVPKEGDYHFSVTLDNEEFCSLKFSIKVKKSV